ISWDHIHSKNAVYGGKVVEIDGQSYKVRLMRGALTDPSENNNADRGAHESEWNRLMLPIHEQANTKKWAYPAYVESDIPDWGIGFTDADLLTHNSHGNGSYSWCQETPKSNTAFRVSRGYSGVSNSSWDTSSHSPAYYGFRPVLELL